MQVASLQSTASYKTTRIVSSL